MGTKKGTVRKDLLPQVEPGDNARITGAMLGIYSMPPIDTSDPKQVEQRVYDYFLYCQKQDIKPNKAGLSMALRIHRSTLWNWGNGKVRSETHFDIIKRADEMLEAILVQYAMEGKINPIPAIFFLKNYYGYQDKQEIEVTPRNPMSDNLPDADEIARKYAELPERDEPLWLPESPRTVELPEQALIKESAEKPQSGG